MKLSMFVMRGKIVSNPFFRRTLLLCCFLTFFLQGTAGCRRKNKLLPPPSLSLSSESLATHHFVPAPPGVFRTPKKVLWVALKPYLGSVNGFGLKAPNSLLLKSAGSELSLKDSSDQIYKASQLRIIWKEFPLKKPISIARQVIGPFASFESAEQVAAPLRSAGYKPLVAHPDQWEVWLSKESKLPIGLEAETFEERVRTLVKPFVQVSAGMNRLIGPIDIEAPDGLIWKDGIYMGPFRLQADSYGTWTLIEKVPLERYLEGVVPHEIGSTSPHAALAAQAVLARTWALANRKRFLIDGYHLCSDTQCQVYSDPRQADSFVRQAIKQTKGKVLFWQGKIINAFYHASNGGVMAKSSEAWLMDSLPYFRNKLDGPIEWSSQFELPFEQRIQVIDLLKFGNDAYGSSHPRFRWERTFSAQDLENALADLEPRILNPNKVAVLKRGNSGRVLALEISAGNLEVPVVLRLDAIRRYLRRLPSTLFVVEKVDDGNWLFVGGGFGHGVGLSQAGAIDLAGRGWTTKQILGHYFPDSDFAPLPDF